MGGARAAVAGVLAAAVVVLATSPPGDPAVDTVAGIGALLATVALLVGVDVWESWRNRRG